MGRNGLTLVEFLVALALLGVLLGLGGLWWQGFREEVRLREAASQFALDLQRARAEARRQSRDWRVEVSPGGQYRLGPATGSLDPRSLPHGVTFEGAGAVVFQAPYGLLDVPNYSFTLRLGSRQARVNVVGLTGKVVVQREP